MQAQIQLINVADPHAARTRILERESEIIDLANAQDPKLVEVGGGVKGLTVRLVEARTSTYVLVHLLVDVRDAMGANAVNTMAEAVSGSVAAIAEGEALLRILTNKADRRLSRARAVFDKELLGGEGVIDNILHAYELAAADSYRAATHNKGIMNGISAVVLATGNDTRAVEAGAHSHAVVDGRYTSLSTFEKNADGDLVGTLEMPMPVRLVGGATKVHPVCKRGSANRRSVDGPRTRRDDRRHRFGSEPCRTAKCSPPKEFSADICRCTPRISLPLPERTPKKPRSSWIGSSRRRRYIPLRPGPVHPRRTPIGWFAVTMELPQQITQSDLPTEVSICEVSPRDGLKSQSRILPAAVRLELIQRLACAGLKVIEAGSFVSPRAVLQMADTRSVLDGLDVDSDLAFPVLVPNRRGLDDAVAAGAGKNVAIFISVTDSFFESQSGRFASGDHRSQSSKQPEPRLPQVFACGVPLDGVR